MLWQFITECANFLSLKNRIEIRFSDNPRAEYAAEYQPRYSDKGRLKKHIIWIYRDENETRSIRTLIAHELIHAWQEERGFTEEIHGRRFKIVADALSHFMHEYAEVKYHLPDIYDPNIDE